MQIYSPRLVAANFLGTRVRKKFSKIRIFRAFILGLMNVYFENQYYGMEGSILDKFKEKMGFSTIFGEMVSFQIPFRKYCGRESLFHSPWNTSLPLEKFFATQLSPTSTQELHFRRRGVFSQQRPPGLWKIDFYSFSNIRVPEGHN